MSNLDKHIDLKYAQNHRQLLFEKIPFYSEVGEIHTIFNGKMIHNIAYYLFLCIITIIK